MDDPSHQTTADVAVALAAIPQGWRVTMDWHNDEWPCVEVRVSRDHGRETHSGHGNARDLPTATCAAIQEALVHV